MQLNDGQSKALVGIMAARNSGETEHLLTGHAGTGKPRSCRPWCAKCETQKRACASPRQRTKPFTCFDLPDMRIVSPRDTRPKADSDREMQQRLYVAVTRASQSVVLIGAP